MSAYAYTFKVEPPMFRRALYFNAFSKQRGQAFVMGVIWALGLAALIANLLSCMELSSVSQLCCIVVAATVPLLVFSCERGWRNYRASEASGKDRTVSLCDEWLKFRMGDAKGYEKVEWRMIAAVYELKDMFIIYRDSNLMVVLPKTAVSADDLAGVRELFRERMGRGFRVRNRGA